MWVARTWFLIVMIGASLCVAGALTLTSIRDDDLASAAAAIVEMESRVVNAAVGAQMADQRRASQLIAADPRLHSTLEQFAPEMPPNVQTALLVKILKLIGGDHPRLSIALIDAGGLRASSSTALDAQLAKSDPALRGLEGRVGVGLVSGATPQWVVATPVIGSNPPLAILTAAIPPGTTIARAHEAAKLTSVIVVQQGDSIVGGTASDALAPVLAKAATAVGANGRAAPAIAATDAGDLHVQRFAVPSAPAFDFVLAWPVAEATGLEAAGGFAGVPGRALSDTRTLLIVLGVALVLWGLGMLLMSRGARSAVRRLSRDLRLLGADRHSVLDPGAYSRWLRPIIDSANEAAEDARKQNANTMAIDLPPIPKAPLSDPPRRVRAPTPPPPVEEAEVSAEVSAEASAEVSAEESENTPAPMAATAPIQLTEDESETSAEESSEDRPGDPTKRRVRTRPQPPPQIKRPLPPSELPAEISSSLFDMSLPSLDADDDDPDEGEPTDAGIELPRSGDRDRRRQGSLLDRLRAQSALDPKPAASTPADAPADSSGAQFSSGDSTVVKPVPIELLSRIQAEDDDRTAVGPAPTRPSDRDDLERYYRQIFDEFIATKKRCGERAESVEFDRFRAKLVRTRAALIQRFECRDVKFRVYVKGNKAALKASPVVDD